MQLYVAAQTNHQITKERNCIQVNKLCETEIINCIQVIRTMCIKKEKKQHMQG